NDMLPKSIAYPMQPRPHCRLEIRVLLSDAGHQTASLLRREFVSHSPLPERRHHFFLISRNMNGRRYLRNLKAFRHLRAQPGEVALCTLLPRWPHREVLTEDATYCPFHV